MKKQFINDKCLAIFIKYPEEGQVKSRLAKDIGNETAKDIYICFVEDILNNYKNNDFDLYIFYSPIEKKQNIKDWLGYSFNYNFQKGIDLGEKMQNAFIQLFDSYKNVIIIGSDSPDLPISFINKGFKFLEEIGTVIGKAEDGGYYLIGFNKTNFCPDIFKNILWSTSTVFQDTINILNQNNHLFNILDEWYDIDEINDLKKLYLKNLDSDFKNSKTMKFITEKNLFK